MEQARKMISSKSFEKSYKKFTSRNQSLQVAIAKALLKLESDPYHPSLKFIATPGCDVANSVYVGRIN